MNGHGACASLAGLMLAPALLFRGATYGQVARFPYAESFDSVQAPFLPPGWTSSRARNGANGDFSVSTGTYRSPPQAVLATNATVGQFLQSPRFDFRECVPETLVFYLRRSSTFRAAVVLEASLDGGSVFEMRLADTLRADGAATYVAHRIRLPVALGWRDSVVFRWRTLADTSGSVGTLRMDDVTLVAALPYDVAAGRLWFEPEFPVESEEVRAFLSIRNLGVLPAAGFSAEWFHDANRDGDPETTERKALVPVVGTLPAGDSVVVPASLGILSAGEQSVIARVAWEPDRLPENNNLTQSLSVGFPPWAVVINEIMYAPLAPEPEWLELTNPSPATVSLRGWTLSDRDQGERQLLADRNIEIRPGGYLVLTADTAALLETARAGPIPMLLLRDFPALNNGGDVITLRDAAGRRMDSLEYDPSWHNPAMGDPGGRSLEKISPSLPSTDSRSWSTSLDLSGGTPGRPNSIAVAGPSRRGRLSFFPNPFSPDDDGADDALLIHFAAPPGTVNMTLRVFDLRGRLIRRLLDNQPGGGEGTLVWDGRDDARRRAHIGAYVVLLECSPGGGGVPIATKGVVVVAGKL